MAFDFKIVDQIFEDLRADNVMTMKVKFPWLFGLTSFIKSRSSVVLI